MAWLQLHFLVDGALVESLSGLLTDEGALAVTITDEGDQPLFEPLPGQMLIWQANRVTALFESDLDLDRLLADLGRQLNPLPQYTVEVLEDQVWERVWLKDFKPLCFAERLWVLPRDFDPPNDENAVLIRLDPGLAFGTGTHPTTALCLQWLAQHAPLGMQVLDFGCGSGILAIAAAKMGAAQVDVLDIDPQAISASLANAAENQVDLKAVDFKDLGEKKYDLLLANILFTPLLELRETFFQQLKPGAQLLMSGILREQVPELLAAYAQGFHCVAQESKEDWAMVQVMRD